MNIKDKKVLVIGSGISGIGAVKLLASKGATPILLEGNENKELLEIKSKLPSQITCEIIIGSLPREIKDEIQLVVLSPGVPITLELVQEFKRKGIAIWGEIELAYQFGKGTVIGITGTNGKTTTTALVGQIMKDYYDHVYIVGNIGNPYTDTVEAMEEDAVTVAEISSFQLETIDTFRPNVSAILNITPDHLDRHHTMKIYEETKFAITRNQIEGETCVLNYDDLVVRELGRNIIPKVFYFSSNHKLEKGIYLEQGTIILANEEGIKPIIKVSEMQLLGIHNVENVMAAIAIAIHTRVPIESIINTVKAFQGVPHRIEYVATKNGVDYYNDSKGTNQDAAIKAIQAMEKPTLLIGGGYDKNSQYDKWIESFQGKIKAFILLGKTKYKIQECAIAHGYTETTIVENMQEAIEICSKKAVNGDVVLLSPACASWDMYASYEERGNDFKETVKNLKE